MQRMLPVGKAAAPKLPVRRAPAFSAAEAELQRQGREYADEQKRKAVKWFVALGEPLPPERDIAAVLRDRAARIERTLAATRAADRARVAAEPGADDAVVVVPHSCITALRQPQHQDPASTAGADAARDSGSGSGSEGEACRQPSYDVVAVRGIDGRRDIVGAFDQLCRVVLLRARIDRRLKTAAAAAAKAREDQRPTAASSGAGGIATAPAASVPRLTLLDMMCVLPTAAAAGAGAMPLPLPLPLPPGAADAPKDAAAAPASLPHAAAVAPSAAVGEVFPLLRPLVPWEFRLKGYRRVPFQEHPFCSADLAAYVPLLFAGNAEVPPAVLSAAVPASAQAESPPAQPPRSPRGVALGAPPALQHFVQPLVTLETYPAPGFAVAQFRPCEGLVVGSALQPVGDGGFAPPRVDVDYGGHRSGDSAAPPPPPLPSRNLCATAAFLAVVAAPLPALQRARAADDSLSDDDDGGGDAGPLRGAPVLGLAQIAEWLPTLRRRPATASTAARVRAAATAPADVGAVDTDVAAAAQRCALTAAVDALAEQLPPAMRCAY